MAAEFLLCQAELDIADDLSSVCGLNCNTASVASLLAWLSTGQNINVQLPISLFRNSAS
jgi:hypothetical protein